MVLLIYSVPQVCEHQKSLNRTLEMLFIQVGFKNISAPYMRYPSCLNNEDYENETHTALP